MSIRFDSVHVTRSDCGKQQTVLCGFSLQVEEGETVALMGRTGSGKSTLARLATGFESPDQGSVHVAGRAVVPGIPHRELGYMTQSAHRMSYPWMTAWDNVTLGSLLRSQLDETRMSECRALLAQLGVAKLDGKYPYMLSGGELKRISLAMVLSYKPRYLILDEPFTGLDFAVTRDVWDSLFDFLVSHGSTALLITHSFDEAALLADRVVFITATGKCLNSLVKQSQFKLEKGKPRYKHQTSAECREYQRRLVETFDQALLT